MVDEPLGRSFAKLVALRYTNIYLYSKTNKYFNVMEHFYSERHILLLYKDTWCIHPVQTVLSPFSFIHSLHTSYTVNERSSEMALKLLLLDKQLLLFVFIDMADNQ